MRFSIYTQTLFILLMTGLLGWLGNLPQNVGADVPEGKLASLSFAPYREGQGPLDKIFPSAEQVEADLRLMAEKTHSIRTYASAEGTMPAIPALARKFGLTMIQGGWLGGLPKDNQIEMDELIRSANANPDVVKRVIVGNEVLLRGDLPPEELIKYIRAVKKAVKQPVSYADVWSMYMKYPELIKEVDFITIHILPYWEDEPIAVDDAPAHIERIYKHVQQEANTLAPNKPILLGESGWPSAGKQRGWAIPSVVNEAQFIRGLIQVATANHFDYNIVEAINQSWKSNLEGVVGANWGLFSIDREEVFPLTGKVYENPNWYYRWLAAMLIFVAIVVSFKKPLETLPTPTLTGYLVGLQLLVLLGINQADFLWHTSYSLWQRLFTVSLVSTATLLGGLLLQRAYALLSERESPAKQGVWLHSTYILWVGFAIYKTACLAINGRYISFPIEACSIPVVGILLLMLIRYRQTRHQASLEINQLFAYDNPKPHQDHWMGSALLLTGIALIIGETLAFILSRDLILEHPKPMERLLTAVIYTLSNTQLLVWEASTVILALPLMLAKKTDTPCIKHRLN